MKFQKTTNISTIYFWVCYYENITSCAADSFDEWKNIKNLSLEIENDTAVITALFGSQIIGQNDDKEGAYALITCVISNTQSSNISEYVTGESIKKIDANAIFIFFIIMISPLSLLF